MGKKGEGKRNRNSERGSQNPLSLREEATGKIQTKAASTTKSTLRIEHLKNLAVWATTNPLIPSLGAFYGQHLASLQESSGVAPDPSLITCQRCESVLHPGFNSTVRIQKNRSKVRHKHKKSGNNITQNSVVYKCHFCLHQNLKRGTPKGYLKGICPSKDKSLLASTPKSKPIIHDSSRLEKDIVNKDEANQIDVFPSKVVAKNVSGMDDCLATPPASTTTTSLEGKKRKTICLTSKKENEASTVSAKVEAAKSVSTAASKRRRKSWTSLKEIAQNNEHDKSRFANLIVPFFL